MLPVPGSAQDPDPILVLLMALALGLILWWRVILVIMAAGLIMMLGLGAVALVHDIHHTVP